MRTPVAQTRARSPLQREPRQKSINADSQIKQFSANFANLSEFFSNRLAVIWVSRKVRLDFLAECRRGSASPETHIRLQLDRGTMPVRLLFFGDSLLGDAELPSRKGGVGPMDYPRDESELVEQGHATMQILIRQTLSTVS